MYMWAPSILFIEPVQFLDFGATAIVPPDSTARKWLLNPHMTAPTPDPTLLKWTAADLPTFEREEGWSLVESVPPHRIDDAAKILLGNYSNMRAVALVGQRLQSLTAIADQCIPISLVYADCPRLSHYTAADDAHKFSTWLSLIRSHMSAAAGCLTDAGIMVAQIDDEGMPYVRAVLDDCFGADAYVDTILWQKKYSPQNDLKGRIDDGFDYLLVYSPSDRSSVADRLQDRPSWWPHSEVGHTQEATQEVDALQQDGTIELEDIPRTSKPQRMLQRVIEWLSPKDGWVLELFTDTCFASAAALTKDRRTIVCIGPLEKDLSHFNLCGLPWLNSILESDSNAPVSIVRVNPGAAPEPASIPRGDTGDIVFLPCIESASAIDSTKGSPYPLDLKGDDSLKDLPLRGAIISGPIENAVESSAAIIRGSAKFIEFDARHVLPTESFEDSLRTLESILHCLRGLASTECILVIRADPSMSAVVRLLLDRCFGHTDFGDPTTLYVGTVAELPEEPNGLPTFHVVYRPFPQPAAKKIGLPSTHKYCHDDEDPRGPWRNPGYKDAKSGSQDNARPYHAPPYRFRLVSGDLPPGMWRINEYGVLWAPSLEESGTYQFDVEIADSEGQTSVESCTLVVRDSGDYEFPTDVWFLGLTKGQLGTSGAGPTITNTKLPEGLVGKEYAAVIEGDGGAPFDRLLAPGSLRPDGTRTRYWAFAPNTLISRILRDRTRFGAKGIANPSFKTFETEETVMTSVELSWWDRSRLKGELARIRLLRMFCDPDDLVCICGAIETTARTALADWRLIQFDGAAQTHSPIGENILYGIPGPQIVELHDAGRRVSVEYGAANFDDRLATLEGFLPAPLFTMEPSLPDSIADFVRGFSMDGTEVMILLPADSWLNRTAIESIQRDLLPRFRHAYVYYYRSTVRDRVAGLTLRRIPFDLACRSEGGA